MGTVYPSKIDAWLACVLAAGMAAALLVVGRLLAGGAPGAWWQALLVGAAGLALPLTVLLATRYIIDGRWLIVRSGPFAWQIAVADITAITPTSSPWSSPALSLDRLRIDYGRRRSLMVSPRDKEGFLRGIAAARSASAAA